MPGSSLWHEVRRADRVNPFQMRHELAGSEASRRTPQLFDQRRAITAVEEARDVRRLLRVERSRHAAPTLFVNPCANMGDDRRGKRWTSIHCGALGRYDIAGRAHGAHRLRGHRGVRVLADRHPHRGRTACRPGTRRPLRPPALTATGSAHPRSTSHRRTKIRQRSRPNLQCPCRNDLSLPTRLGALMTVHRSAPTHGPFRAREHTSFQRLGNG